MERNPLRNFHRYLSLFISIQFLLWTASGIFFSFNKIEDVRGEQYILEPQYKFYKIKNQIEVNSFNGIEFFFRLDDLIYSLKEEDGTNIYYQNNEPVEKITFPQAFKIIETSTSLKPTNIEEIVKNNRGSEYRGRSLPLFKVRTLNNSSKVINVYLDPYSGKIKAIRSSQWRMWDFLWGLHIMDWTDRDNFNNNFIKFFSILAFISALSGIVLFFKTRRS